MAQVVVVFDVMRIIMEAKHSPMPKEISTVVDDVVRVLDGHVLASMAHPF